MKWPLLFQSLHSLAAGGIAHLDSCVHAYVFTHESSPSTRAHSHGPTMQMQMALMGTMSRDEDLWVFMADGSHGPHGC